MTNKLLKGKKGIIFGALNEQSLAWHVALKCKQEGAEVVLTNGPLALRLGEIQKLAQKVKAPIIPADAVKVAHLEHLIDESMRHFDSRIDFVLHSVAMSVNIRKQYPYTSLNYDFNLKTLDVSAVSFHKFLQVAFNRDAISEWGSIVALTFLASHRVFPHYGEMADAKALLESIARSFGLPYGIKHNVRINTISQSPTYTMAGSGVRGFDRFLSYSDKMSPLGNAPAADLAKYCVTLFSDYTRYVTMQNLYHDGGFSATGITPALAEYQEYDKV